MSSAYGLSATPTARIVDDFVALADAALAVAGAAASGLLQRGDTRARVMAALDRGVLGLSLHGGVLAIVAFAYAVAFAVGIR